MRTSWERLRAICVPSGQEANGRVLENSKHIIKQVGATEWLLSANDQPDTEIIHNTHMKQTSMPPVVFEPAIPRKRIT
jgi:hypothetical protein